MTDMANENVMQVVENWSEQYRHRIYFCLNKLGVRIYDAEKTWEKMKK